MKFKVFKWNKEKTKQLEEKYFLKHGSFDCKPAINIDINILIKYLNLGVDSEDMCVKCLWGFSPMNSWEITKLSPPVAEEGKVRLVGKYEPGLTWRIDKNNSWKSYFDKTTGWYCVGSKDLVECTAVKVNKNMIIVLDEIGTLMAVWIKPVFE